MKNNASLIYSFFLVVGDFLALVAAFVGAFVLRVTLDNRPVLEAIPARTYFGIFLTLLPFWILIFAMLGLYRENIHEKRFRELGLLFTGSFIGLLFVIGYDFVSPRAIFPARLVPLYGFGLAFVFLVVFRTLLRFIRTSLFSYNIGLTHVLLVGSSKTTKELIDSLINSRASGYKIVGVVGKKDFEDVRMFSSFTEATEIIGTDNIHSIVQTELYADQVKNSEILTFAQTNHIAFRFIPGNTELFVGNISVELFRSSIPVVAVHQTPLLGWGRIVKRLFDIGTASILILITSPILLLISAILAVTGGDIFYRQKRLTRYNHVFRVFKFRTIKHAYNKLTPEEAFAKMGKPEMARVYRQNGDFIADDPRFTRFGKFLRKTSLDELPQLFNVVGGDLSLVGPRALIPQELERYAGKHTILSVKSGLTGLAVVSGRRGISFEERRKLDVYYAQNWTFWLDITILLKTIRVVLRGEGNK
jgi:exopolysaccharide biosynthesis polyprenyl glycosylphosphotransferase